MNTLFYIAAVVAVTSTSMVITRLNVVHALLYLIVSLLSVALIFFILGAPFVAALEVIIYAGAIMVLFVFVIMMLTFGPHASKQQNYWLSRETWIGPFLLSAVLLGEIVYILTRNGGSSSAATVVAPKQVGIVLFGPYLLGVELASVLLLSGLIGAYCLGRRDSHEKGRKGG